MSNWQPHINCVYPPNNEIIFEEWFLEVYKECGTDRELIPALFTGYWVNNNYGNDLRAKQEMQEFVDGLDRSKKWFCICQYDDGVLIDFKDLDVLQFNMSKQIGVQMPLMCMPHPYKFSTEKKYTASFIGSKTHPLRNKLERLIGKEGWYISFEPHSIESYCNIIHESIFSICPRGYGINSFRISESIQYGAIPVYWSDRFVEPFKTLFSLIGLKVQEFESISSRIESVSEFDILEYQKNLPNWYEKYYTYNGCFKQIIKFLETEYNNRQPGGKDAPIAGGIEESGAFRF